jgi:hypothetical protein
MRLVDGLDVHGYRTWMLYWTDFYDRPICGRGHMAHQSRTPVPSLWVRMATKYEGR